MKKKDILKNKPDKKSENKENAEHNRRTISIAVIGGIVIAAILIFTTIRMGQSAKTSTDEAVYSVSEFYLEELAGRREQIVASNLNKVFSQMRAALSVISDEDLQDERHLEAYLEKAAIMYDVDKFALIRDDGTIYTSGNEMDHFDDYSFSNDDINEPTIYTYNLGKTEKSVILAMPVDNLSFGGISINTCFVKIDIFSMLEGLSLQTDANDSTFCNLYYKDGTSLTEIVLGGMSDDSNLLNALENANFNRDFSYDKVKKDFTEGSSGLTSFSYMGTSEYLYYTPVEQTGWMLTYLIRENKISSQISSISNSIMRRSVIRIILTVVVMLIVFIIIIMQARKASRLRVENEKAQTESRIKQEEMEERIKLQNRLLEEERKKHRRGAMIRALSSDYRSVYYFNMDINEAICYRVDLNMTNEKKEGDSVVFSELLNDYINEYVVESDREELLNFITPDTIRENLKNESVISHRYLICKDGQDYYEMIKIARVNAQEEIHEVGVGFADVDKQTRESFAKNKELADALAQAQHANASKTTFLSNMSHDIRTPMNAIIGFTNMALRHIDNRTQVKDSLEKVLSSSDHLLRLINDILDMSRIESGRVQISEQECNLSEIVHNLVNIIQSQVTAKQQELNIDTFEVKNEDIYADPLKVNQVLINILSNAVKYTPATGKISFRISQEDSEREGYAKYEFRIKDNGMGMSEEFLKHIFDAFEREETTTRTGIQGTGLGMAITKNIVELMNGDIEVYSEKGKGSEFVVTFEFRLQEDTKEQFKIEEAAGLRALVVDDDFNTCDSVTKMLKQIGMRSEWTTSSRDAVFRAGKAFDEEDSFNVYIIDWLMPEKNGVETAQQIRRVVGDSAPIIILTAYDWSDVEAEARAAGVTAFLAKPLFMSDLKAALSKAMGNVPKNEEKDELSNADFSGKRVLLVEDIELNRQLAKYILTEMGVIVEEAPDGFDAVRMIEESEENYYDLILTDVQMPIMDGYEATRTIRNLERSDVKNMPIIAMTANAFDEDREHAIKSGMDGHIAKPLEINKLLEVLKKYLQ